MLRKLLALIVLALGFAVATPADANCAPPRVGFHNGKPVVQLEYCDPLP